MQQVRYFVALAETLNFTRAAEQCHVTQPALTRAIKALEAELGGELVRREGRLSHLTELGKRMLPLLRQCYDTAQSAKAVAKSVATGEARALALGLSRTVDLRLLGDVLAELFRRYPNLRLNLKRGGGAQIVEYLRAGEVEIAIAGPIGHLWNRVDAWPIFNETYDVLTGPGHRLSARNHPEIQWENLVGEIFITQCESETVEEETQRLQAAGICRDRMHVVDSDSDIAALVGANIGVALAPRSAMRDFGFARHLAPNIDLRRTVAVYTVAGRPRSPEAATLIQQLRATDWDHLQSPT